MRPEARKAAPIDAMAPQRNRARAFSGLARSSRAPDCRAAPDYLSLFAFLCRGAPGMSLRNTLSATFCWSAGMA